MKIKPCNLPKHLPRNINSWPFQNYSEPSLSVSPPPLDTDFSRNWKLASFSASFSLAEKKKFLIHKLSVTCFVSLKWVDSHVLEKSEISHNQTNDVSLESAFSRPVSGPFFHLHNPFQSLPRLWTDLKKSELSPVPVTELQSRNVPLSVSSAPLFTSFVALTGAKGMGNSRPCSKT